MLHRLASHNDDIRRLLEKGYAITIDSNMLVVRDIFYLDEKLHLQNGAIVSKLIFTDLDHVTQDDHQAYFCGSHPYEIDGTPLKNMGGGEMTFQLVATDISVQRSFSNKPLTNTGVFRNFIDLFEKIESYVNIISGPAIAKYPGANVLTFRSIETENESFFKFNDTLTSRAELGELAADFKQEVVAVIGLGGTGAYILDFISKTPVKEIRGFDADEFHIHNAFRSPGKVVKDELRKSKAEVYQGRYEDFRHGIKIQAKYITKDSAADLEGVTFAFVCVDKGESRAGIFDLLVAMKIPFIDVGMGLNRTKGSIDGMLRVTYYSVEAASEMVEKRLAPLHDDADNVYKANIQLSELNALNACLAMLRFKQVRGFYIADENINHLLFSIHDLDIATDV